MLRCSTFPLAVLLACGGPWVDAAWSQPAVPRRFHETVSIAIDNEAAKTLLTIDDRWAAGRWQDALDDLIALSETRPDAIVQSDWGDDADISRYQPVVRACERWLARLPPAGLKRYRERVAPAAEQLWARWEQTGDVHWLEQLVERFFFSEQAETALWTLGQQAWQRGDPSAARDWWSVLLSEEDDFLTPPLRRYPVSSLPAADVAAHVVLCGVLSHDDIAVERSLMAFQQRYPDVPGNLGARKGRWIDLLTEFARTSMARPSLTGAIDVATFAGSNRRTSAISQPLDLGSELWSVALPGALVPRGSTPALFPAAPPLAYYPAVVDDVVYVNDGSRIWAWSLYSGKPAWDPALADSARIYPALAPEDPLPPRRPVSGGTLWTVTVGNGRLYARMGSVVTAPTPLELRDQVSELICLDLAEGDGRLLWKVTSSELSAQIQSADPDAPPWMWEGTPLVIGTRIFAAMSRRRPQLEWSVACLDGESGRVLWHRTVGMSRPTPPDHENLSSHLLLSAGNGALYLSTSWGAVVSLAANDGDLRWAVTYESDQPPDAWRRPGLTAAPPCLVTSRGIYVAPADSHRIYCLDAETGELMWTRRPHEIGGGSGLPVPFHDRIEHLLGIEDGCLVASGRSLWGIDAETGQVRWKIDPGEPTLQGYGRGWLAEQTVYWPTQVSIVVVDTATGAITREHPLQTPEDRRFGGHLVAVEGVLLVASHDRITAYGEYARLRNANEQWLSAHPRDARSGLRQLELTLAAGEFVAVNGQMERFDRQPDVPLTSWQRRAAARQIQLLVATQNLPAADLRERFAQARRLCISPAQQSVLLEREVEVATDLDWKIDALHRRGQFLSRSPPSDRNVQTLWQVGRTLQHLRKQHGAASFAQFDAAAKDRLDQLDPADDPELLHSVRSDYPTFPSFNDLQPSPTPISAVDPPVEATARSATSPHGYWRRDWQRTFANSIDVLVPMRVSAGSLDCLLVVTADGVSLWECREDRCLEWIRTAAPPLWSACDRRRLVLRTADELLAVSIPEGDMLWRIPVKRVLGTTDDDSPAVGNPSVHCVLTADAVTLCEPSHGVAAIDIQTGDIRWRRDLKMRPWRPLIHISDEWILAQDRRSAETQILSTRTGQTFASFETTGRPWLRSPVVAADGNELILVDDQRTISAWSLTGRPRWTHTGPVTFAHADPWVFENDQTWYAVIDGLRLVELKSSGFSGPSIPLSTIPIRDVSHFSTVTGGVFVAASNAGIVGVDLRSMTVVWRQPFVRNVPERIIAHTDAQEFLIVMRPVDCPDLRIVGVWAAQSGELQQTIPLPGFARKSPQVTVAPTGLLVSNTRELTRFTRPILNTRRAAAAQEVPPDRNHVDASP